MYNHPTTRYFRKNIKNWSIFIFIYREEPIQKIKNAYKLKKNHL